MTETLANFAASPVHTIQAECFDVDAVDVCLALEDFLSVRVCRPGRLPVPFSGAFEVGGAGAGVGAGDDDGEGEASGFYDRLKRLEVVVVARPEAQGAGSLWRQKQAQTVCYGVGRLVRYCRDLGLLAVVRRKSGAEEDEVEWDLDEECSGVIP